MKALQTSGPPCVDADRVREDELARIIVERAGPRVRAIISRYSRMEWALGAEDAEDVAASVRLQLLRKIRQAEDAPEEIRDFDGYVATTTYNALYDTLRRRFPERTRLKNRLRYLLAHDDRFALWNTENGAVCGFRRWEGREAAAAATGIDDRSASNAMLDRAKPAEALMDLFRTLDRPLLLNLLVDLLAELWDVVDRPAASAEEQSSEAASPGARFEWTQYLRAVWARVGDLRRDQAAALLLNLRDDSGENALAVLIANGIASFDEIARAAGITSARLRELWDRLPLEDSAIASILGVPRQHVINYRYAARRKLAAQFPDRNL